MVIVMCLSETTSFCEIADLNDPNLPRIGMYEDIPRVGFPTGICFVFRASPGLLFQKSWFFHDHISRYHFRFENIY